MSRRLLSDTAVGGTLDDGAALPRLTAERLVCDASVVRLVEDSRGNVLDVGRRRRTIPTLLRRALRLRDHGCRFPGCTNRHVDGHHVRPWSQGGATSLDNLCSLCRRHHTYVHELGFRLERTATGHGFRFFFPDGREVDASGVPISPGPRPVDTLRAQHQARGLLIDATTNAIHWDGRRTDYDHVVWSLMRPSDTASPAERDPVAGTY